MSIMYCEKHDRRWDSDKLEECPQCENEARLPRNFDDPHQQDYETEPWVERDDGDSRQE